MSASGHVLQLIRAHYAGHEDVFASSAMALARGSKIFSVRDTIQRLVREGARASVARASQPQARGLRRLDENRPRALAGGMLEQLKRQTFEQLMLPEEIQELFDEISTEIEYTEELSGRGLRPRNRILLHGPPGCGKCLGIGTPVLRYDGSVVAVESVREGDLLMGPDSLPRRVSGVVTGSGELFRVTPTKGTPWICNAEHVLTVVHSCTNVVSDISVRELLGLAKSNRGKLKLFFPEHGIDFVERSSALPVDPYFVGVWYGDGTKADKNGILRSVSVSKPDREIRGLMERVAEEHGLTMRVNGRSCPTYSLTGGQTGGRENPLLSAMRVIIGDGTMLPSDYLTATRRDRAAFLAGLVDSDGYVYGGSCCDIVQKRSGFADGICFLARSLGIRATLSQKLVNGEPYWRVCLSGPLCELPTRIPRKRALIHRQKKRPNRTGFTVEPIGIGDYAGFEVDRDGRFLLGDLTVTHNTSCSSALAAALDMPAYGVSLPRLIGSHMGETGANLATLFDSTPDDALVVFDELDAIGGVRGGIEQSAGKEFNSTLNTMLTLLDRKDTGIIVATTNRLDILDPALVRRFDEQVLIPEPTHQQKLTLATRLCEQFGVPVPGIGECANYDAVTKLVLREARKHVMREIRAQESQGDDEQEEERDGSDLN